MMNLAAALTDLSLAARLPAASTRGGACCQAGSMDGRNESLSNHAFSNLKILDFGIYVERVARMGTIITTFVSIQTI
jgi:hypothetical protein